ncbi:MAG: tetratricopeptide repeat protein [Planctomycetales bacterium]|nr:tetratricopeptide repeat protein [Planctomycetales bacterium]
MTPSPSPSPRAFLTDFGLAKCVATGSKLTRTGEALGTPAYMSPEQARGEGSALTPASDVWSLGCVLFEMLAGRPPFEGATPAALIAAVLTRRLPEIRGFRSDVPRPIERVLAVTLQKRDRVRYRDSGALRDDLDRVLRGEPPRARLPRSPWRRATLDAAALALLGVAAWAAVAPGRPPVLPAVRGEPVPLPVAEERAARAARLRASDPAGAARLLAEALGEDPSRQEWHLERGLLLWAAGGNTAAREEWERIPAEHPAHEAASLYLGLEQFFGAPDRGRRLDALGPHLAAVAAGGGPGAPLARAGLAILEEDWRGARELLREERRWEASLLRAYIESVDPAGDDARAQREYTAALSAGIPFAWVHSNRGVIRSRFGDLPAAIADFDAALALRPGFADALHNRGRTRQKLGDTLGALEDLDAALKSDPELADAYGSRGISRAAAGDLVGALRDLDEAVRRRPEDATLRNDRGVARLRSADLAGAIEDLDKAIGLAPDRTVFRGNRGMARHALGDVAGAIEDLTAAVRGHPGESGFRGALGFALRQAGEWSRAAEALREFLRLAPDDPMAGEVRSALAECEARARDAAAAPR